VKEKDDLQEMLKHTGLTKEQAYKVLLEETKFKPKVIEKYFRTSKLKIGVVSDTHLGSWYECLDELHTFYKICEKQKVKAIVHAGDILDGNMRHQGWENEIHTFGADRQVNYCAKHYPSIRGVKTYFIDGNHDLSHWKKGGIQTGKRISEKRKDMVCLGDTEADVVLNGVKIRLRHPTDGTAYAKSYKGQKIVNEIESGMKPQILIIGHYHYCIYFFARNIHVFHPGAFQRQTQWMRGKHLKPDVGGWILEIHKCGNEVLELTSTWIPFYRR